jgi:putative ABC transport system substrate-binding protein
MNQTTSLNRPVGNVTGITLFSRELGPKRLALMHELLPTANKIALLLNQNSPQESQLDIQSMETAARTLGLEMIVIRAGTEQEIESAFATVVQQRADALFLGVEAYLSSRREQIAALALRHALPTISSSGEAARAGQLMSYSSSQPDMYRQAGVYVGRVLKGERSADLPVMQPTKFELLINLQTARTLGLTVPPTLLAIADEVIE